ncbi:MAG: hypothetical protein M1495_06035 [Bacteroidetes bacterium]|nr:hypothetical protein [Bacteroidota bacterium]MCL6097869.1 hypothetical protein [Bacteroidota bacterium]
MTSEDFPMTTDNFQMASKDFPAVQIEFPATLDQKTSGSTPDGAALKGLKMICFQTFFFLTRQKSTVTFGF